MKTRLVVICVAAILAAPVATVTHASVIAYDSFDYADDAKLDNQNGGSGWDGSWDAHKDMKVEVPGLSYTDDNGNMLNAIGGQVFNSNKGKSGARGLPNTWGGDGTTVWLSVLIEGVVDKKGSRVNVDLLDSLYIGQGGKDKKKSKNWTIYGQDNVLFDSGIPVAAKTTFLVAQIDFSSGDDKVWLWIDPALDATPDKSTAVNTGGGTSVADFGFDAVGLNFESKNKGFIDELRLATTFGEVVSYTAAPANDSTITAPGSLSFGNMLVGHDPAAQNVDLTKTGADATTYTAIASSDGITVAGDGDIAAGAQTETISIDFNTNANGSGAAGAKSLSVTIDNTADTSAGAGEGSDDPNDTINVTASVYQEASVTANNSANLDDGDTPTLNNAAGTWRSAAFVTDITVTGNHWSAGGIAVDDSVAPGGNLQGVVSFDQSGLINGQTFSGSLDITLENNPNYLGATDGDLGTQGWTLSHTVSGNIGDGTATVGNGKSYAGLRGVNIQDVNNLGSVATILGGTATAARALAMDWRARTTPEENFLISDIVDLDGMGGDTFVLQISYNEDILWTSFGFTTDADEEAFAADGGIYIVLDLGTEESPNWVHAGDWETYAPIIGGWDAMGSPMDVGKWGIDTDANVAWVITDHNSKFGVTPEPGTLGLLALGACLSILRRTRR